MDPLMGAGVVSGFGGLASAYSSWRQAEMNRDFQERMSSTSHQREVQDLMAAGLNPILSAGGSGASQPTGADGSFGDPFSNAVNTGLAAEKQSAEVDLIKQNQRNAAETEKQIKEAIQKTIADTRLTNATAKQIEENAPKTEFFNKLWGMGNDAVRGLPKAFKPVVDYINQLFGSVPGGSSAVARSGGVVPGSGEDRAPWWLKALGVHYWNDSDKSGVSGSSAKSRGVTGGW